MSHSRLGFFTFPTFISLLLTVVFAVGSATCQNKATDSAELVLTGGKLYASPTAAPIEDAVVVVQDGKIVSAGKRGKVVVPKSAYIIDCRGKFITAGFWNSHVHFTEDAWNNAAASPADKLEQHMQEMLTSWGFTTVFDIGSNPADTLPLRRRVNAAEIPGPTIYTTAGAIYPENGIPVYIPKNLAEQMRPFQAATPADAARLARHSIELGGDGIKVFAGAIAGGGQVTPMPVDVIRAAVDVAHGAGKPVFAHPSNHVGTDNALAGGVDVLAHTIPMESDWTPEELQRIKQQHVALTPTLSLFPDEERKFGGSKEDEAAVLNRSVAQLKADFENGGVILFGTDVGYTKLYDTTSEYEYMGRAGMTWRDILASLTTNPATFFKATNAGEVIKGNRADLVVLNADPASDVRNFSKVDYTIRAAKVIYKR